MRHYTALLLFILLTACLQSHASTNVLSRQNEFGGLTVSSFHLYPDMEYIYDDILKVMTWFDAKGTNRMKVIFRTPVHVNRTWDFKETTLYDTNGRLVSVEVARTNGYENNDCYSRRIYHYDSQPFSYMTEIIMTPACAEQDTYSVRREYTDPQGRTNQTWFCYTGEFWRGTGRKYKITTWSPIHRMDDLAVVYSNDNFLQTGYSRVVEHYDANEYLYMKEFVVDPARTNESAFSLIKKHFDRRGRPEKNEYFFTARQERMTGVHRAVVDIDDNAQWTKLTVYNGRGFVLTRKYGAVEIKKYLNTRKINFE